MHTHTVLPSPSRASPAEKGGKLFLSRTCLQLLHSNPIHSDLDKNEHKKKTLKMHKFHKTPNPTAVKAAGRNLWPPPLTWWKCPPPAAWWWRDASASGSPWAAGTAGRWWRTAAGTGRSARWTTSRTRTRPAKTASRLGRGTSPGGRQCRSSANLEERKMAVSGAGDERKWAETLARLPWQRVSMSAKKPG